MSERSPRGANPPQHKQTSAPEQPFAIDSTWKRKMRKRLLAWFDANARDLPWRRDPTPYRVWVSEIMLQQTQVATVIDYFNRFIAAFPTVNDLAAAPEHELMRLWEGLGYYRRARMMHQAAKRVAEHHRGEFPADYPSVLALPGIGRYTAGAILSISTDAKLPIVEGNTVRVFARWTGLRDDVKSKAGVARLWQIAETMLLDQDSGRFNQAAMELGALVCKPVAPNCDRCPVSKYCEANRLGLQDEIPGKVTRMDYEDRREFAFVVPHATGKRWLVGRVPEGERWAGLWDFPRVTDGRCRSGEEAAKTVSRKLGVGLTTHCHLKTVKHAVTRYRITLEIFRTLPVDNIDVDPRYGEHRFVSEKELTALPLSVTGRKIAKLVAQDGAMSLF